MLKEQTQLGRFSLLLAYLTVGAVLWMMIPSKSYTAGFWQDVAQDTYFNLTNAYGHGNSGTYYKHD
jgi:hypothetical protein